MRDTLLMLLRYGGETSRRCSGRCRAAQRVAEALSTDADNCARGGTQGFLLEAERYRVR